MAKAASGVSVQAVADLLNLTPRRVQQLAAEGAIPKPARGRYDLPGCVRGYIALLQEQVRRAGVPGTGPKDTGVVEADRRERQARAALAEMKAAQMRGLSVSKEAYEAEITLAAQRLRAAILGMPGTEALEVVGLPDRARAIGALQGIAQRLLKQLQRAMADAPLPGASTAPEEPAA